MWEGWIIEHCVPGQKYENKVTIPCWPVFELLLKSSSWMSVFRKCSYIWNSLIIFWEIGEIHSWSAVLTHPLFPGRLPNQSTIWSSICVWFPPKKSSQSGRNWTLFTRCDLWLTPGKTCWTAVSHQICLNPQGWEVRDASQPCGSSRKFGLTYTHGFYTLNPSCLL